MSRRFKDYEEEFDRKRDAQRHGTKESREPGEKLSWRELDRRRDRSGQDEQSATRDDSKPKHQDRYQKAQAEKALKNELGSLFSDTGGDSLRDAILDAEDRATTQTAVDAFLDERDLLPADGELLEKALDVRNDRTLRKVIESAAAALPDLDSERRKLVLFKMRTRMRTSFDAKVSRAIKALLQEYDAES